jgi:DNA-binding XRE family transcriptional regulator
MGVSLRVMMERLPPQRRPKIQVRADTLIAEEMSLRDLRRAMDQTQVAVAEKLGLNQENISRLEQRGDVLLSTLDSYVRALGGKLCLTAEFEGRPPITLTGFAAIAPAQPAQTRKGPKRLCE